MRLLTYSFVFLLAAVFLIACNGSDRNVAQQTPPKPASTATPYPDGARRITIEELDVLIKEGKAYIVDVRTQDAFDLAHIPGSVLIPTNEITARAKELPRDKTIVTYCS